MSTPEELLCRRGWRLRHGAWMLWGILSFSMLAFVGWLYVGMKSKRWAYVATGAGLLVWTVGYVVVTTQLLPELPGKGEPTTDAQQAQSAAQGGVIVAVWAASSVAAWFANRKWLVWRAHNNKALSTPWYANATATSANAVPTMGSAEIGVALDSALGTGKATLTPPAHSDSAEQLVPPTPHPAAPSAPLDLNKATQQQLATLPGIDGELASHIVAVRARQGGFRDATELVTRAGVKPHVYSAIQSSVSVPAAPTPPSSAAENGRRLEF